MKYFYIAAQRKIESGYYAYWFRVSTSDNLVAKIRDGGFIAANICPTKTAAIALARAWDNSFIENGTYAFNYTDDENDDEKLLPF